MFSELYKLGQYMHNVLFLKIRDQLRHLRWGGFVQSVTSPIDIIQLQCVCLKGAVAPSVHASLNCYNFFCHSSNLHKSIHFFKAKRLMNPTMSMN